MLTIARTRAPTAHPVRGESAALPFRDRVFAGAIAAKSLVHVERTSLPMALAELHRVLRADSPAELVMFGGDQDLVEIRGGDLPGRRFALWERAPLCRVIDGAGFRVESFDEQPTDHWPRLTVRLRRLRTLPDTVGPRMQLLVCGLNPSLHAADTGVGFGRPGNRFWPAARSSTAQTSPSARSTGTSTPAPPGGATVARQPGS